MTTYDLRQRDTEEDSTRVLVDVTGELDLTNAREVEERLEQLTANGRSLVLDLNKVVFIDSAALHVLFRTARRLGKDRFSLVVEPDAAIARTLGIVGIPDVATVGASADEPQRG